MLRKKAEERETEKRDDAGRACVYSRQHLVRCYTAEEHGKNYRKLAEEFAEKNGYSVE